MRNQNYVQTLKSADTASYVLARYATGVYAEPVASIGENIKVARIAAGVKTQGELAKRLSVPQPQLSDWENDRYGAPDTKTLLKIASAIPCALDDLVRGIDDHYDATRAAMSGVSTATQVLDAHPMSSASLWEELTSLWNRLSPAEHRAVLAVVRSMAGVKEPNADEAPSPKQKARRGAHRSR